MFFFKDISQKKLINTVNKGLKQIDIPLELNATGICNGLVFLAIEYFLLNQKEKFFEDLEKLIEFKDPHQALPMILRLMILFRPQDFSLDLTQLQSYQLIKHSETPIKPTFVFGAVMTQKNWIAFFNQLNLQEDEMVLVSSPQHVVYLMRKGVQYQLYDPNEEAGEKNCKSLKSLINALSEALNLGDVMGLDVQVFQKVGPQIHLKDSKSFYDLVVPDLTLQLEGKSYNSLELALRLNDPFCLEYFKNDINEKTLKMAVLYKADAIVEALVTSYEVEIELNDSLMKEAICWSLVYGSYKIFNDLIKKEKFSSVLTLDSQSFVFIGHAIFGEHPELFEQVLRICTQGLYKKSLMFDLKFRKKDGKSIATDLLINAVGKPQHQITVSLIKFYQDNGISFNEFEKQCLLIAAIQSNDLVNLLKIIESYPPENFSNLRLNILNMYEMCPELINELKAKGVLLSFWQECCLQSKDSIFLSIVFCVAMYFMYAYRWVCDLTRHPMKSIYFEELPKVSEEIDIFKQLANLEEMAQVFKRKKPKVNEELDNETKPFC